MNRQRLRELLLQLQNRQVDLDPVVEELCKLPLEMVPGVATLDGHRELRTGIPEVVFGESKTAEEIALIVQRLAAGGRGALATRVDADKARVVAAQVAGVVYHERGRVLLVPPAVPNVAAARGTVAVVCAGTSDLPVAEEARLTLEFLGHPLVALTDVGVAGLHRVMAVTDELRQAEVIIVVAGMEGALPTVVASLVDRPVIAVPTSVGYGVGVGGFVAMQTMLTSCSPGLVVVNIDNGFGAAVAAARMNRKDAR